MVSAIGWPPVGCLVRLKQMQNTIDIFDLAAPFWHGRGGMRVAITYGKIENDTNENKLIHIPLTQEYANLVNRLIHSRA